MAMTVTSPAFAPGEAIPRKYTGEGEDLSPPLAWTGVPTEAVELAMICDDPDAPTSEPWVHWVWYGLDASVTGLPEGLPPDPQLESPVRLRQGRQSWSSGRTVGYRGPLPPPGHGVHHYHFKLYALDQKLDLPPGATKSELLQAMRGHVVATGELVGTYER